MATVTHAITTAATTNATSYVSGSFTPAAGDLLIVFVRAGATAATGTMTDSQGLGFTKVNHATFAASAHRVYCFVANAAAAASSMTVTFDCTGDAADGAVIFVARVAGMVRFGASAVRQNAVTNNGAAAGTPATTFSANVLTGNPTLGSVGNGANPATLTPPAGWTEAADSGYATPTSGGEYVFRNSGFGAATVTWAAASATTFGVISIELDSLPAVLANVVATPRVYERDPFGKPKSQIITVAGPAGGITFGAIGAKSPTGETTTLTIAYPTGVADGDIAITGRMAYANTVTFTDEAGWTNTADLAGGTGALADDHTTRVHLDRQILDGTETGSVIFDQAGGVGGAVGIMARYAPGTVGNTWSVAVGTGDDATHGADRSITTAAMDLAAGDMLVAVAAVDTDVALTITVPTFSASGITFGPVNRRSPSTSGNIAGQDGNIELFDALVVSGSGTVAVTFSFTTTTLQCGPIAIARLREVAGAISAAADLTVTADLTSAATKDVAAAADLTVTAALTSAATKGVQAAADLAVTATLSAAAIVTKNAQVSLVVTAGLTAAADTASPVEALLPIAAALTAAAFNASLAAANLAVTAALTAAATRGATAATTTIVTATLTAAATVTRNAQASLPITAGLTGAAARASNVQAPLAVTAGLAADAATGVAVQSTFTAGLTAAATRNTTGQVNLSITAGLTGNAQQAQLGQTSLTVIAGLAASAAQTHRSSTSTTVTATLTATATVTKTVQASLIVTATLMATVSENRYTFRDVDLGATPRPDTGTTSRVLAGATFRP